MVKAYLLKGDQRRGKEMAKKSTYQSQRTSQRKHVITAIKKDTSEITILRGRKITVSDGYESSDVLLVPEEAYNEEWILDLRCSFHMTPNLEWFEFYKDADAGKVLMGNNLACEVIGIRTVGIKMADGSVKVLIEVRHVPDLKRNVFHLACLIKLDAHSRVKEES